MEHGLSKEEIQRYSRQLLVSEVGITGQDRLKNCRVLVLGAGGLGCPVSTYLAGAGIGTLGLVDFDEVSTDNLHRQVAHKECNVGMSKTESLKQFLNGLNHHVKVNCHDVLLNKHNALGIVENYDIVVDCSDNAATRYLINDACVLLNRPLVSGSALRWEGQLTVYHYGEDGPCYRCLFPSPPSASLVTNCSEGGVLGPIVGTIGSMQALEVIKIASGLKPAYSGRLFLFDGLAGRTRCVAIRGRSPKCDVCGENPTIKELIDYEVFCGAGPNDKTPSLSILADVDRVSVVEYQEIRSETEPILIDTRPPNEYCIANLPEAKNVPLPDIEKLNPVDLRRILGLPDNFDNDVFVVCHRGNDSQLAVEILKKKMAPSRVRDLRGGYDQWAEVVDDNFPKY